ncbi:MAG: hypothetical protein GVY32_04060 [Gammaproteobacteria bacterium]|jgi:hypothetical protein|nr:hypothetical protein [Gammaproteobacteria bacterium]
MTGKERHHQPDDERLAQLYGEQGDIEPGPGIDQRIRARARDAAPSSRLPRPASWLGGVAVAASLVVVVAIVVDTEPPGRGMPEAEPVTPSQSMPSGDADRAGASAFSASETEAAGQDAVAEPAMEQAIPSPAVPSPSPPMERRARDSAADDAARTAREQYEALGSLRQTDTDGAEARELLRTTEQAGLDQRDDQSVAAERALWLIERLIDVGNTEQARARFESFRDEYPGHEIPPALLDRLEALEPGPPEG